MAAPIRQIGQFSMKPNPFTWDSNIENFKGYNGSNNLKKAGVKVNFTPEMENEWIKCKDDPIYFSEQYIRIVHVDRGLIPMILYPYQKEIVTKFNGNRKTIVCTSRQAGKTTTAVAIILHYILFNRHKTVAVLANKLDAALEIMNRIQLAYEYLPKWMQAGVVEWNKGSIELENGCKIIASATSGSAIRGKSCALVYIDECAFVNNWDEFFTSVYPTISSGKKTKMLFTSTPNGLNHFYKYWEEAQSGRNGFAHVEVKWDRVPGRDEAWKTETLQAMSFDLEKFAVEYECEFQGSSGTLISGTALKALVHRTPLYERDGFKQYEEPIKGNTYLMTCDVSRGKGLDFSAFHVIDITKMPYRQVATFKSNLITPTDYAFVINKIGTLYNTAHVLVENNDIGGQVADMLFDDYDYENLLFTMSNGRSGKILCGGGHTAEHSIRTTTATKAKGCSVLKLLIEQQQLVIQDFDTINELSRFSKKGKSYEAESGHDDLVMCLVLASWASAQAYFSNLTDVVTLQHLRDQDGEWDSILPLGFRLTGNEDDGEIEIPMETLGANGAWRFYD